MITRFLPEPDNNNHEAYPALKKIRRLLLEGKYREASELTEKTQVCKGKGTGHGNGTNVPFGSFQTLGDLWIEFNERSEYTNYYRELDLNNAVIRISYLQNGVKYYREIFTSYPDQVMVARFSADKPGKLSFEIRLNRQERYSTKNDNDQLIMFGKLNDGYGGSGLEYMTRIKVNSKNGTVR